MILIIGKRIFNTDNITYVTYSDTTDAEMLTVFFNVTDNNSTARINFTNNEAVAVWTKLSEIGTVITL